MTSRPSVSALFASASTEVPSPQAQDQGLVPHLGDRGSHKRVASESWDVASSRLPPHPARSHAARGSLTVPHRRPALSSSTVPARCTFKTTNCSSRRSGAPPTGGTPALDCTLGTGDHVRRATEVNRAERPASLFSAENIFWVLESQPRNLACRFPFNFRLCGASADSLSLPSQLLKMGSSRQGGAGAWGGERRGWQSRVSSGGRLTLTSRSWPGSGVQASRLEAQSLRRWIPLPLSGCGH